MAFFMVISPLFPPEAYQLRPRRAIDRRQPKSGLELGPSGLSTRARDHPLARAASAISG
jgi:hypothetical protein